MYRKSQFSQICGIPVQGKRLNWNDFYKDRALSKPAPRRARMEKRNDQIVKKMIAEAYNERENRRFLESIYPKPEMPRFCPCEHKEVIQSPRGTSFGIEQLLGTGGFGKAYGVCWIDENRKIAMKVMNFSTDKEIKTASVEANNNKIISKLFPKSNYFPTFFEIFVIDGKIHFSMEKLDADLAAFVANCENNCIELNHVKTIGRQILEALMFLHGYRLVHCDIKLENIMFANPPLSGKDMWHVKIIDFGLMRTVDEVIRLQGSTFGTYTYLSPEMYLGLPMDEKIDLWSVGIVLLELCTGRSLFVGGCKPVAILAHILRMVGVPENVREGNQFAAIFCEDDDSDALLYKNPDDLLTGNCSYKHVGFEAVHKIRHLEAGVPSNQIPKTVDDILFKKLLTALLNPNAAERIGALKAREHRFFDWN